MSDSQDTPQRPTPSSEPVNKSLDAATWALAGVTAVDAAMHAYQAFRPMSPPPPQDRPAPPPKIELPPGVDLDK
jgi:hypothetical protein